MKILFSILLALLLFGINNTFSANSTIGNVSYSVNSGITKCENLIPSIIAGIKNIPIFNNFNAPSSGSSSCQSGGYYGGTWSLLISKGVNYQCPNEGYAAKIAETPTDYRVFCMYKLEDDNIGLNSTLLSSFGVADGQEKNIRISFPFGTANLESLIDSITFTFRIIDNTSINGLTNTKHSVSSSAVTAELASNNFAGQARTITYNLNSGNLVSFKNGNGLDFKYKFYNPTSDTFTLNTISYSIKFKDGGEILGFFAKNQSNNSYIRNSNIAINTTPLFTVNTSGEFSGGFTEGASQLGTINISKNKIVPLSGQGLYFVQNNANFSGIGEVGLIKGSFGMGTNFLSLLNTGTYTFKTLFTLINPSGLISDIKNLRLSNYIRYTVGGRTVTYLAGTLNTINNQNFDKLKVYGITNIDIEKQKDLILDQDTNDIQNLAGEIIKAGLKRDIKRAAIKVTKFVNTEDKTQSIGDLTGNTWNDSSNGGKVLGNTLYYDDLNGGNVELGNGSELSITGKKTIIVIGGNLYIKSNIINDNNSSILGIIVLKDENGKGGKVYIDTSVQKVDAIMYMDKSIMSYNESYDNGNLDNILKKEVDLNINSNFIKNQIYIYGSVFSENTIGGSRLDPPVCPFYTDSIVGFNCDIKEAQKYDLNYLRVGYANKYDPSYDDYPIIINYNSSMQSSPPPLFIK